MKTGGDCAVSANNLQRNIHIATTRLCGKNQNKTVAACMAAL